MEIEWKPSKLKRQFRTKRQKQTQQRQDTAHYQEHSAKLLHIVILRQTRLATDYADWHGTHSRFVRANPVNSCHGAKPNSDQSLHT